MKTNIARQPIFNEKNNTIAYKLLFRSFEKNSNSAIFNDGSKATTEVIKNWLINFGLEKLTNNKRAFITFTESLLLQKMPQLLRKDSFTIELEPSLEISDELLESIIELKSEGYNFALTANQLDKIEENSKNLIEVVKIDFIHNSYNEIKEISKIYQSKNFILFAEKIETIEAFQLAKDLDFKMFQGYYFEKPTILETNKLSTIPTVYLQLLEELNKKESNSKRLAEITKNDVTLTYSVLNIVNSVAYYSRRRIKSLKDAYTRLGMKESKKIIYFNFLKTMTPNDTPNELVRKSLIRGKQAELLSSSFDLSEKRECLFLLGLLSLINIILKDDMSKIIKRIHLSDEISEALLGKKNHLSNILDIIILYERNYEQAFLKKINEESLDLEIFSETYLEALLWSDSIFEA